MQRIMKQNQSGLAFRLATLFTCAWAFSVRLHAAAAGNLPWERPMQTIATSLTGPGGIRYRPDRNRDRGWHDVVGR